MGDKSENVCEDETLQSVNSKTEADGDGPTDENHKLLVECMARSAERAKQMLQTQGKEVKLSGWNVDTAKTYIGNYRKQLIKETQKKKGLDGSYNVHKILDQQRINDLMQNKDINLLQRTLTTIKDFLAEQFLTYEDIEQANLMSRFYELLLWNEQVDIQLEVICIIERLGLVGQPPERKRTSILKLIKLLNYGHTMGAFSAFLVLYRQVMRGGRSCYLVLTGGFVSTLKVIVKHKNGENFNRVIFDEVSKIFSHYQNQADITVIAQLLPVISLFIYKYIGLLECVDIIASITRMGPTYCRLIIDSGLLDEILPLFKKLAPSYTSHAFQALEKIAKGSEEETQKQKRLDESNNVYKVLDQRLISDLMQNNDIDLLSRTITTIRDFLTERRGPTSEDIEQANLMSRFHQFLDIHWYKQPDIQFNVICIIELLVSVPQPPEGKRNLILKLMKLMKLREVYQKGCDRVAMKAISVLCREVMLGGRSCYLVLTSGFVSSLLVKVKHKNDEEYSRTIFDMVSRIFRHDQTKADITVIAQLLPLLSLFIDILKYIGLLQILDIITDITKMGPTYSQLIIDSGLLDKILPLVCRRNRKSGYTAEVFSILENIATGSDEQKVALLDAGVMVMLRFAFFNGDEILLLRAMSFLKKMIGNNCNLLQVVVESDLFPMIVHFIEEGSNNQLCRESLKILTNFFMIGGQEQLMAMAERGAISALCGLLGSDELALMALKAIQSFATICSGEGLRLLDSETRKFDAHERIKSLKDETGELCQSLFAKIVGKEETS